MTICEAQRRIGTNINILSRDAIPVKRMPGIAKSKLEQFEPVH